MHTVTHDIQIQIGLRGLVGIRCSWIPAFAGMTAETPMRRAGSLDYKTIVD